jgi:hypothetical protein
MGERRSAREDAVSLPVRPLPMWIEDVMRTSGVRRPELLQPEWRRRLRLWRDSGETVESAAENLRRWPWPRLEATPTGSALRGLRERMAGRADPRKLGM